MYAGSLQENWVSKLSILSHHGHGNLQYPLTGVGPGIVPYFLGIPLLMVFYNFWKFYSEIPNYLTFDSLDGPFSLSKSIIHEFKIHNSLGFEKVHE
jgi:hypothetical protein